MTTQPSLIWKHRKQKLAVWSRWLHIYLSMVSFAVVFFFAVTGVTLNHLDWFGGKDATVQLNGKFDTALLKSPADAQSVIVQQLRAAHHLKGSLSDFRVDDAQCAVSFKGPGYTADAFINRETGAYELTETRLGFVAVINDLHKGRDSGRIWSWLIDASAVLLTLVSLSGMVLIWFVKRYRASGLLLALMGALLGYLIYAALVP